MTFLNTIIANKKKELSVLKKCIPVGKLEKMEAFSRNTFSLRQYLKNPSKTGIIAEFKRKSPSRGWINENADPEVVTKGYANHGASGLSVLTDTDFFGGTNDDLMLVRSINDIPVLRKEFILEEYQVVESKAIGADVVLILAAAMEKSQSQKLAALAHSLGLETILEIHSQEEFNHISKDIDIIGINNRDLKTFNVDTIVSLNLVPLIPEGFLKISESGIHSTDTIKLLRKSGFDGFLMGEVFMKDKNPVASFSDFVNKLNT